MKNSISIFILLIVFTKITLAQILTPFPCYSVANNNGAENALFKFDPSTNQWNIIGTTGAHFIDAIAIDGTTGIIYAAEGPSDSNGMNGAFGTIDPTTGTFTEIGTTGTGNGVFGPVNLNDIDGMSFDPVNQIMYATHRVDGDGQLSNDLLFQIDVSTGAFVPNAMIDALTGFSSDYALIEEVFDFSVGGNIYDVEDIAFNAYTGELFALHSQNNMGGVISILDAYSGALEFVALDISESNIAGLSFTYLGELYGTTRSSSIAERSDIFVYIDVFTDQTFPLTFIDAANENTGFESFDCDGARNDLALEMNLDPSTEFPLQPGDLITCEITIYNQGGIDNTDITLTNYLPNGLTLSDANWINLPNHTATTTITDPLEVGTATTLTITLLIGQTYTGNLLTNTVEITASFNPDIQDSFGNPIPLSDIDSIPNDQNDENEVVDNEVNAGGPNANEDEDDHDIVQINLNSTIPNNLNLTGSIKEDIYRARQSINANGQLESSSTVVFEASESINLNKGFSVESNTFFDAEIDLVE